MRRKAPLPTLAEDAAINRGIALDPDNPELDDDFWRNAKPAKEVMPPALYAELTAPKRRRGPGKVPAKVLVSLRLRPDVLERLRATGPGWQTRAEQALTALAEGVGRTDP